MAEKIINNIKLPNGEVCKIGGASGFELFDTALKDHILTYEQSKGWALQGTYVYKEAVAGSRYGYPDFYQKCVKEYGESEDYIALDPYDNVDINGTLTSTNGVLTGFGATNYATTKGDIKLDGDTWEIVTKFKLASTTNGNLTDCIFRPKNTLFILVDLYYGNVINPSISISSNGTSYDIAQGYYDNTYANTFELGKTYTVKLYYTGTEYKLDVSTDDGLTYKTYLTVASDLKIKTSAPISFGYTGATSSKSNIESIDLNSCYVRNNNNIIWKGIGDGGSIKKHNNGHLFYDIANKSPIDEIYNTNGIAWYYGIDTENERIFLPRTKWFIQPSGEITEVNTINEAGLPTLTTNKTGNHTHTRGTMNITGQFNYGQINSGGGYSASGAFTATSVDTNTGFGNNPYDCTNISFDASRSWTGETSGNGAHTHTIEGTSDTVQPPSINQLLYICVGNTTVDTSHIDIVTQVENGVKDIDDAVNNGVSRLNSIDSLKYNNITNCLLEVPQRIKLELNNGVLTLKAGSQVIVPNGFEEDGVTPRFDYVDIETDFTMERTVDSNNWFLFYDRQNNKLTLQTPSQVASGTSDTFSELPYHSWYDTGVNLVKNIRASVIDSANCSLPLCLFISTQNVGITSLSQVFNGFGYIGSTVWVDKGVKGLIPNGRNEDGSLKNVEIITEKLTTVTYSAGTPDVYFGIDASGSVAINGAYKYKEQENRNWHTNNNSAWNVGVAGVYDIADNGLIVNFNPKQPVNLATRDMVDGRLILTAYGIVSNIALGANSSATYDLSSYLPNDGHTYEVLFSLQAQTGSTSGYDVNLSLATDITPAFIIAKCITRAGASVTCVGTATVPVGPARKVTIKQHSTYPCDIVLLSTAYYRRIGTNL